MARMDSWRLGVFVIEVMKRFKKPVSIVVALTTLLWSMGLPLSLLLAPRPALAADTDITINEVMFYPSGTETGNEWIELYNSGAGAVNLNNWGICSHMAGCFDISSTTLSLAAGAYLTIHWRATGNDTSTDVYTAGTPGWEYRTNLPNNNGNVVLYNAFEHTSNTIIDYVEWAAGSSANDALDLYAEAVAVTASKWTDNTYIDTTIFFDNETVERTADGAGTLVAAWQVCDNGHTQGADNSGDAGNADTTAPVVNFIELDMGDADGKTIRVEFNEIVTTASAQTLTNYTLTIVDSATVNPTSAALQGDQMTVLLGFATAIDTAVDSLAIVGVADMSSANDNAGNATDISGLSISSSAEGGGWFGSQLIINEIITDPQQNWSGGTPSYAATTTGAAATDDELVELYINETGLDLTANAWFIDVYNADFSTLLKRGHLTANSAFVTARYVAKNLNGGDAGTISATEKGDFLVLGDLNGADMTDNVHVVLNYDTTVAADFTGVFFDAYVDGVSLGTFDDGYTSDNAPAGTSTGVSDESVGRNNFSNTMGMDSEVFAQQRASAGYVNNWDPAMELYGVYAMDSTHVDLDFSEPPLAATLTTANFSISPSLAITSVDVDSAGQGRYIQITTAAQTGNTDYTLTITDSVTDANGASLALADRTRHFQGHVSDTQPPSYTSYTTPDSSTIELTFNEYSGLDASGASFSITGGLIVSSWYTNYDKIVLSLDASTPQVSGTLYTITISGLTDYASMPNAYSSNDTITFTGFSAVNNNTAPYVVWSAPAPDSSSVPTNMDDIVIGFSERMDSSTLTTTNITLHVLDEATNAVGNQVTGLSASYDSNTDAATLTFDTTDADWAANTYYRVTVTADVEDITDDVMDYPYTLDFRTTSADNTPPQISNTSLESYCSGGSCTDVPTAMSMITIYFDSDVDPATVNYSNLADSDNSPITLSTTAAGSTSYMAGSIDFDAYGNFADIWLSQMLQPSTTYTLTAKTSIKDAAGNAMPSQYTLSFTTIGTADLTGPTVLNVDVEPDRAYIQFDEPLNITSAGSRDNYTLTVGGSSVSIGEAEAITSDNAVVLRGFTPLTIGDTFSLTVSGVTDMAGNEVLLTNNPATGSVFDPGAS